MERTGLEEVNLFAESDNDCNENIDERSKRKRKRDLLDKNCKHTKHTNIDDKQKSASNKKLIGNNYQPIQPSSNEDTKNLLETNPLWSIEETFFYPLGIRSHYIVGVNKSVITLWSEFSVINFVIKRNTKTKQTKTTLVNIDVPHAERIKDIQFLELNTLLLLESGRMNFFSSSKSMHTLPWLDQVRCIAVYENGFSVIRFTVNQKLMLELYDDIVDMGKKATGPLKQKYDITFDEHNLFNCGWENEHYYLLSTSINDTNLNFLQLLTRNTLKMDQKELHLFAISGNLFVLIPDCNGSEYHIEMLFSYSSNIAIVKLDFKHNFCLIFLQCGVIDVWYLSSKWHTLQLRHQTHTIGVVHTSFSYSESRAAFYFTDGDQITEFRFSKIPESDELSLHETYKAIPGILACTWIEAIEQLVCLDCNNIFHQISFDLKQQNDISPAVINCNKAQPPNFQKFNTLFELTPQRVTQLLQKAHIIRQINELPKILVENIEQQFRKQELLAVSGKIEYYKTLLSAHLEFSCGVPCLSESNIFILYTQNSFILNTHSLVALIYIEIKQNEIFESSLWQLHLKFDTTNHIFTLSYSLMRKKLCIIVPLKMKPDKLLPEFFLHLYTFVACGGSFVSIDLPISITKNKHTYLKLFTFSRIRDTKSLRSQKTLDELIKYFKKEYKKILPPTEIKNYCFIVPKHFKLNTVFSTLENEVLFNENTCFDLNFLGSKISISHNTTNNAINLKCDDIATIFYMKMHLKLTTEQQLQTNYIEDCGSYIEKSLRFQCNVERLYGELSAAENNDLNEEASDARKLQLLKEFYLKMREELIQPLCL